MNMNQFTQKTVEALQSAQRLAVEYSNQALEQEHILAALAQQSDGLIPQMLTKMNVDPGTFSAAAVEKVAVDFGKPTQRWLDRLTAEEARARLITTLSKTTL